MNNHTIEVFCAFNAGSFPVEPDNLSVQAYTHHRVSDEYDNNFTIAGIPLLKPLPTVIKKLPPP